MELIGQILDATNRAGSAWIKVIELSLEDGLGDVGGEGFSPQRKPCSKTRVIP
jgi:hypothetical protein